MISKKLIGVGIMFAVFGITGGMMFLGMTPEAYAQIPGASPEDMQSAKFLKGFIVAGMAGTVFGYGCGAFMYRGDALKYRTELERAYQSKQSEMR